MKVTFTGDSLAEIHQQILREAEYLKNGTTPLSDEDFEDSAELIQEVFTPTQPAPAFNLPPQTAPQAQGVDPTMIDGYRVSNGQVWVPMADRPSAFHGVPVDKYLAQKGAVKTEGALLDSKGTPYDPAIHTSTKAKKNDGTWKLKPGGGGSKPEDKSVAQEPEETEEPELPPVVQDKPKTVQEVVTHENAGPPIGRAPSMHNYESFKANLMNIVVVLINEKKITREYMQDLNTYFGVTNLWDVKQDDVKCQQLFKLFIDYQFIMGA